MTELRTQAGIRLEVMALAEATIQFARECEIKVVRCTWYEVRETAVRWNNRQRNPDGDWRFVRLSDDFNVYRVMVNYVRHNLSNYDELTNHIVGKHGQQRASNILREACAPRDWTCVPSIARGMQETEQRERAENQ